MLKHIEMSNGWNRALDIGAETKRVADEAMNMFQTIYAHIYTPQQSIKTGQVLEQYS